ncbi:GUN4 domain-containing protein [Aerosakkonemataceae cyanobacterium BLCC-F154]|uniref:GUN4 domain-containing protein n=1 Tax=Floridaenema fluviatile BLCC-F154 TaxID=3153640 RepID=A0ABV4YF53_9CYAN
MVDYTTLNDLLAFKKWKDADIETARLMLEIAGKKYYLDSIALKNFPCDELRTIDKFWIDYSKGHFGFSIQKSIYLLKGNRLDDSLDALKYFNEFANAVGWRDARLAEKQPKVTLQTPITETIKMEEDLWLRYNQINFSLDSPPGHLPAVHGILQETENFWRIPSMASSLRWNRINLYTRLESCDL